MNAVRLAALLISTLGASAITQAHHSVPVNFDTSGSNTITGTLVVVKWVNPHSQLQVEVTTADGEKELWLIEMNAKNTINRLSKRMGFELDDFVVGEEITVQGWPGRHDRSIYFRSCKLASGKEIVWQSRLDPDLARIQE